MLRRGLQGLAWDRDRTSLPFARRRGGARCVLVFFSGRHGDQRPTLSLTVLLDVLMRLMLGLLECIRLQDDREIARGGLNGRDEFHGAFLHFLANGIVTFR